MTLTASSFSKKAETGPGNATNAFWENVLPTPVMPNFFGVVFRRPSRIKKVFSVIGETEIDAGLSLVYIGYSTQSNNANVLTVVPRLMVEDIFASASPASTTCLTTVKSSSYSNAFG